MSANDFDFSQYTPVDNTGTSYSVFSSAYKNVRFSLRKSFSVVIDESDMANLVGIAFRAYGEVSLWYLILAYNGIQDQVQEVYPGVVLDLPSKPDVIAFLSSYQNNQPLTITI